MKYLLFVTMWWASPAQIFDVIERLYAQQVSLLQMS